MLMQQISENPLKGNINLIGSAIGNGCWGNSVGTCAFSSPEAQRISSDFYYGHGMYSQTLRQEIVATCGDFETLSPTCLKTLSKMNTEIGNFNIYNVYDECGRDQRRNLRSERLPLQKLYQILDEKSVIVTPKQSWTLAAGYGQALNDYQCGAETAMDVWLSEPSVIDALHVKANTVGMQYTKTAADVRPLYSELIDEYQMLIYSGDTDGCVPFVGSEYWTRNLNYTLVKDWHQWFGKPDDVHSLHKAGYAVTYDKFQFITVNGAGHMVPQYQPGFSLTMFEKFLANEVF